MCWAVICSACPAAVWASPLPDLVSAEVQGRAIVPGSWDCWGQAAAVIFPCVGQKDIVVFSIVFLSFKKSCFPEDFF